jgi:hypothetical protein
MFPQLFDMWCLSTTLFWHRTHGKMPWVPCKTWRIFFLRMALFQWWHSFSARKIRPRECELSIQVMSRTEGALSWRRTNMYASSLNMQNTAHCGHAPSLMKLCVNSFFEEDCLLSGSYLFRWGALLLVVMTRMTENWCCTSVPSESHLNLRDTTPTSNGTVKVLSSKMLHYLLKLFLRR